MACERHREELLGAAAGWLEPERGIRLDAHLRDCPACREEFERQQGLFAAMEEGLRERVNEELPVGFAARVRACAREEAAPRWRWISHWVPAWGAVAAAAVLAAGLFIVPILRQRPGRENQTAPEAHIVAPRAPAKSPRVNSVDTTAKHTGRQRSPTQAEVAAVSFAEPEVLLPVAQKKAMALLVEGLRNGNVQGEMLLAESGELQPVHITPVVVDPVELKPLEDGQQQSQ